MLSDVSDNVKLDLALRWKRVQAELPRLEAEGMLIVSTVNILYLSGRIFLGYVYVPAVGEPWFFVKRPCGLSGGHVLSIRKVEQIPELLAAQGVTLPKRLALEQDELAYSDCMRIAAAFSSAVCVNGSLTLRRLRAVRTPGEIEIMREAGRRHAAAYAEFPGLYKPGMTDRDFSIEAEHTLRKAGSLGMFRVFGQSMEIFVGLVLAGDNAGEPSPYDFALGGAGEDRSIPVGENGTVIASGMSVMADLSWNTAGYLTDMSRIYSCGRLSGEAYRLHDAAVAIEQEVAKRMRPGVRCEELYDLALQMAADAGGADCFMGLAQKAKFVGHGTGLVINELPVLGARSKDVLEAGMCIAVEPKFVLPGVGAVGTEDTFLITESGTECLTELPREIIDLC